MLHLGALGSNFQKLLSYLKSAPMKLSLIVIFHERIKTPKFGTKNGLFGYFWARILKQLLSHLK